MNRFYNIPIRLVQRKKMYKNVYKVFVNIAKYDCEFFYTFVINLIINNIIFVIGPNFFANRWQCMLHFWASDGDRDNLIILFAGGLGE